MMRVVRRGVLVTGAVIVLLGLTLAQKQKPLTVPGASETALKEALDSYRKGAFDQAVAKYNEVLKADPQLAAAHAGLARCYVRQDKVNDAAEVLQKALAEKPSDPELKVAQGEVFFREGRIYDAEKNFVDVINSGSMNARAYLGLARISSAITMYAREYKMIVRAHELDSSDPDIRKLWLSTLPPAQRIKALEDYLGQAFGDDEDQHNGMLSYLAMMKARQASARRTCRLVSNVTSTETDLARLMKDAHILRGYGLPVVVNNQKSKLRLDTGAGGILINRKLAERAGIQRAADIHTWGIGNKSDPNSYIGFADSIRIGSLEFHDCPVEVFEGRSLVDEEGLIGADVFSKFLIEIDFPAEKLRLSALPPRPGEAPTKAALATDEDDDADAEAEAGKTTTTTVPKEQQPPKYYDRYIAPEMNSYARVYRFGHALLVPTKVNDVQGKLFLIDSGAFDNIITPETAKEVTKVHGADWLKVKGLSGEVNKVYTTDELTLEFGHLRQKKALVAIDMSRLSRHIGTEVSGTLGFAMLGLLRVRLDYRDALVDFEYIDPTKKH